MSVSWDCTSQYVLLTETYKEATEVNRNMIVEIHKVFLLLGFIVQRTKLPRQLGLQ